MIELELWLYGKPAWDMNLESNRNISADIFRATGEAIHKHLQEVADIFEKLSAHGWKHEGLLYTIVFYKDAVTTKEQARAELKELQISPKIASVVELEDEG